MHTTVASLIFTAGVGQLAVLIASALVPFRLNWRAELQCLSRLHRQMYWVYGGYIVLSIVAFAALSILNPRDDFGRAPRRIAPRPEPRTPNPALL